MSKQAYWFNTKILKFFWFPQNLEGWLVTLGYLGILAFALWESKDYPTIVEIVKAFTPTVGFSTLVFLFIVYKKGDSLPWLEKLIKKVF